VIDSYEWSGTCCSLSDRADGGCSLSVNGPGSFCERRVKGVDNYFAHSIADENTGQCPLSQYIVPIDEGCLMTVNGPGSTC
jgi:hypothetical protein